MFLTPFPPSIPLLWCWNETNLTQPPYLHVLYNILSNTTQMKRQQQLERPKGPCLSECITLKKTSITSPGQHIVRVWTINHTCVSSHEILVYSIYLFLKASMVLYSTRNMGNIHQSLMFVLDVLVKWRGKGFSPLFPLPNLCVKNDNTNTMP